MNTNTKSILNEKNSNSCWIHLEDLRFFLFLGANPYEKKIGQNIKVDLSIQFKFEHTEDKLENTLDYGLVIEHLKHEIEQLTEINLLEYLCEKLINSLQSRFDKIQAVKISVEKGYVPLQNFPGKVRIEAEKYF